MALHSNPTTVLIVEDELVNFLCIKTMLQGTDMQVIYAANGQEAVDICQKNMDISLVLMDIRMPVMNGYLATKKIKAMRPGLPVVAQTAYMLEMDMKDIKNDFDEFLIKPINRTKFRNVISKYCNL
jgi:two-component system sensor histidine kinase EvgS